MEIIKLIPQIKSSEVFFDEPIKLKEIKLDAQSIIEEKERVSSSSVVNSSGQKVGRNDPCPCGSGKKYKKCGELNTEEHQKMMQTK
jgi:uncharacterized protein YecA (UPF0149 family)